jgi:hypothetical protein
VINRLSVGPETTSPGNQSRSKVRKRRDDSCAARPAANLCRRDPCSCPRPMGHPLRSTDRSQSPASRRRDRGAPCASAKSSGSSALPSTRKASRISRWRSPSSSASDSSANSACWQFCSTVLRNGNTRSSWRRSGEPKFQISLGSFSGSTARAGPASETLPDSSRSREHDRSARSTQCGQSIQHLRKSLTKVKRKSDKVARGTHRSL